jgi:hypothetical protein
MMIRPVDANGRDNHQIGIRILRGLGGRIVVIFVRVSIIFFFNARQRFRTDRLNGLLLMKGAREERSIVSPMSHGGGFFAMFLGSTYSPPPLSKKSTEPTNDFSPIV